MADDEKMSNAEVMSSALDWEDISQTEGSRGVDNLNVLCGLLGYDKVWHHGSKLEYFLADNSGCIEAIHTWIVENMSAEWRENLLAYVPEDTEEHRGGVGVIPCEYCGELGCDFDCDESQAGGFDKSQ